MDSKINITQKLLKIVKKRKTLLVVNKQESGYNRDKKVSRSLSHESYSYDSEN